VENNIAKEARETYGSPGACIVYVPEPRSVPWGIHELAHVHDAQPYFTTPSVPSREPSQPERPPPVRFFLLPWNCLKYSAPRLAISLHPSVEGRQRRGSFLSAKIENSRLQIPPVLRTTFNAAACHEFASRLCRRGPPSTSSLI
jgi:hypothetical protein